MELAAIIILSAFAFVGIMFTVELLAMSLFLPQLKNSVLIIASDSRHLNADMLRTMRIKTGCKLVIVQQPQDCDLSELLECGACDAYTRLSQLPETLHPMLHIEI